MKTITRRAAVASLASAPMISSAAVIASAATVEADPVFAAIDAAKIAETVYLDALERAENEAPDCHVLLKCSATENERIAINAEGIDRAFRGLLANVKFKFALPINDETERWSAEEKQAYFAKGRDAQQAFEADNNPDALKAELKQRHAAHDAAHKRHNVEALQDQYHAAFQTVTDTPATTFAGIAAKLRFAEIEDEGIYSRVALAAIEDADRLAKQGRA